MNTAKTTLRRQNKAQRLERVARLARGKFVSPDKVPEVLKRIIEPGDRLCLEGDNQKQADFLANQLATLDKKDMSDIHLVMSCITLPAHIQLFKKGMIRQVDFCYAGPQGTAVADFVKAKMFPVGAIHTYNELYARYYIDLTPRVALIAAAQADRKGNLFLAANTEETPAIVEPTAFSDGIVFAQVNEIVDKLPRIDIPADQVDLVVQAPYPMHLQALFTRDPAAITDVQVLMAMVALRGIYEKYEVQSLNHGVGFNTAAIELLLPTYAERLGLKGKICKYWMVNPLPTMIPAIEAGWVESVFAVGGEVGMERYTAARSDIFFTGRDGSFHSNRAMGQLAGHYAIDMFIGASLQIDVNGNSSTVSKNRITGFGGAPNMGCQPTGRRHPTKAWLKAGAEANPGPGSPPGRKLVVQMVETFQAGRVPTFVEQLDAAEPSIRKALHGVTPVMIYGDDVTHIVTEEGIANLAACRSIAERQAAIRAVAGYTPVGLKRKKRETEELRRRGIVQLPEDVGVRPAEASRSLLAAQDIKGLVRWSNGLYDPPPQFVDW
ncbi:MAG: malonate decarboxylase subunit alpha [Rhodospirillales bacterium]|nr:malonate decarboxylase subunit alpha [Rhodospirillales bacterium]